jgi:hypothetical protein
MLKPTSNLAAENEDIIRAFTAAWASRDLNVVMRFFAEDAVYRGSVGPDPGETWRGKDAIRLGIAKMFSIDAGSVPSQGRVIAMDNIVFAEWIYNFEEPGKAPVVGCDLFELRRGLITLKDAYRKVGAVSAFSSDPIQSEATYRQRRFTTRKPWVFEKKRFKVHLISHVVDQPPYSTRATVVEAAKLYTSMQLREMVAEGNHFDLGYVVLHEGESAHWLLINWWIRGGICCSILSNASHERPTNFSRVESPYSDCVWEAVAVEHERRAWVDLVLSGPRSLESYLSSELKPGLY